MIIAELIDDECAVESSGEIRYLDVEVDDNQIITKPGEIVFIPEEIHQVSKDVSLKMVRIGNFCYSWNRGSERYLLPHRRYCRN